MTKNRGHLEYSNHRRRTLSVFGVARFSNRNVRLLRPTSFLDGGRHYEPPARHPWQNVAEQATRMRSNAARSGRQSGSGNVYGSAW